MVSDPRHLRVLAIYIEPAPYILDLLRVVREQYPSLALRVLFIAGSATQPWQAVLDESTGTILPARRFTAIRRLWAALGADRVDLLHLAGWGHPLLLAALFMAALRGIPVAVESDTPLLVASLTWRARLKRFLHPLLFRLPRVFLPGGQPQAQYLRYYGVPDDRIHIAQMTVDTEAIAAHVAARSPWGHEGLRDRWGLSREATVFLYLGRLEPVKGIEDLFAAFHLLRQTRTDVELLLVGDGSLRSVCECHAAGCRAIRIAGRLQGADLFDACVVADVLVLPSRSEPWGLVVNEAMAAGLPVVVTDVVGCIDDLVIEGQTGWVVPPADPRALGMAMQRLADDQEGRDRMGERARAHISGWTLESEAGKVMQAWRVVHGAC